MQHWAGQCHYAGRHHDKSPSVTVQHPLLRWKTSRLYQKIFSRVQNVRMWIPTAEFDLQKFERYLHLQYSALSATLTNKNNNQTRFILQVWQRDPLDQSLLKLRAVFHLSYTILSKGKDWTVTI